jgi:hypothetical protein
LFFAGIAVSHQYNPSMVNPLDWPVKFVGILLLLATIDFVGKFYEESRALKLF